MRAMSNGVDSGWVFLGIVRSINLCFQFGRVMDKKTGSESFWCYGSYNGNLLLTVVERRWRRQQVPESQSIDSNTMFII